MLSFGGDIARATLVSGAAQCAGVSRPCVPFPGAWISRVSNTPPFVGLDFFGALFFCESFFARALLPS